MAKKKPPSIKITKLDAARNQIDTALRLWFEDGDLVSIHTLTAAAHQICHAILKHGGEEYPSMIFSLDLLSAEARAAYKKYILAPENFFKHATNDPYPNCQIELPLRTTELYLVDAVFLFHKLSSDMTPSMKAFALFFNLHNPDMLKDEASKLIIESDGLDLRKIHKSFFLKAFLDQAEKFRLKYSFP